MIVAFFALLKLLCFFLIESRTNEKKRAQRAAAGEGPAAHLGFRVYGWLQETWMQKKGLGFSLSRLVM